MLNLKVFLAFALGLASVTHATQAGKSSSNNGTSFVSTGDNNNHVQHSIRRGETPSRGVSLGGRLVAEYWMSWTSPLWGGVPMSIANQGEYAVMQYLGQEKGDVAFEKHRATWIIEQDIAVIANARLNTVRVPVGYWIIYDDPMLNHREVNYPKGGLQYLDDLMTWGEKYNVAVMLSLHAHPGSQNGFEHSAPFEFKKPHWSDSDVNLQTSLQFATYLAGRYKSSPAFLGMSLMNEPAGATNPEKVKEYFLAAYAAIRNFSNCVLAVSPMVEEQDSMHLTDFMRPVNYFNVWHELHKFYFAGMDTHSETQVMGAIQSHRADPVDVWIGEPGGLSTNFLATGTSCCCRLYGYNWLHYIASLTQFDPFLLACLCLRSPDRNSCSESCSTQSLEHG